MADVPGPHASFASTCALCLYPTPVHKDGLCAPHWRDFGPHAWPRKARTRTPPALPKDDKRA